MFKGSLVALVTPMCRDLSVDAHALQELVEWHINEGSDGIVAVGTTGESATLTMDEHVDVIRKVVAQVKGRVPVIAGTGANSVAEALELTEAAKQAKVDACLLVTPYYNKPTQEGLYQFHKHIAERVAIPQILYNVPSRTGVDMLPATVARLAEVSHIVGIKDATGQLSRLEAMQSMLRDDFILLSGDDATLLDFMLRGGHGGISVTANVAPRKVAALCELIRSGEVEQAREIDAQLSGLNQSLFCESNPIPVKWAMAQMNLIQPYLRLPLTPLSSQYHHAVSQAMVQADLTPATKAE